ncbi:hypothetical protein KKH39_05030 [Patescibacteria group bacterium]|nr:hypothetical protein [Patescibacteria group bacterium]
MYRRKFLTLVALFFSAPLVGCGRRILEPEASDTSETKAQIQDFIMAGSIAAFMQSESLDLVFDHNTDWSFPQGDFSGLLFITNFEGHGLYGYEVYVDGQYIPTAINVVPFNSCLQRMRITRFGQTVWRYSPPPCLDIRTRPHITKQER